MALEYRNRKGIIFYLHVGTTKKGKPKYYFSRKKQDNVAESIPRGYEIYENPNAQVFLRKIQPKVITDAEVELVRLGLEKKGNVKYFMVETKKDAIIVYKAANNMDELLEVLGILNAANKNEILKQEMLRYEAVMQFQLVDKEKRLFIAKRYCYRGSIDDWIYIGDENTLDALVNEYVRHVGRDSFYDLL